MRRWILGELACLGVTAALLVTVTGGTPSCSPDGSGAMAPGDEPEGPGLAIKVLGVEGWASDGFQGLAAELAARPGPPTWDEVRRTMERRGCVDLRYALTVRSLYGDGSMDSMTYIHQPYSQLEYAAEFLRYLRGGPDAAVWKGEGEPPWKAEATGAAPSNPAPPC